MGKIFSANRRQRFESLPNEILMEIFYYIDPIDLRSFKGLNKRIDRIIEVLKINVNIHWKAKMDPTCLSIFNPSQIIRLEMHIHNLKLDDNNSLPNNIVRSLTINKWSWHELRSLLYQLPHLCRLDTHFAEPYPLSVTSIDPHLSIKHLRITLNNPSDDLATLLKLTPNLVRLRIRGSLGNISVLKHLNKIAEMLFDLVPHLQYFHCELYCYSNEDDNELNIRSIHRLFEGVRCLYGSAQNRCYATDITPYPIPNEIKSYDGKNSSYNADCGSLYSLCCLSTFSKSYVFIYDTENSPSLQYYDCLHSGLSTTRYDVGGIKYCRQLYENQSLNRHFNQSCHNNGILCSFEQLSILNLSAFDVLKWSSIDESINVGSQLHNNRPCYTTLICDSGLMCLDWRHICKQQCMEEFNECEDDEYRCANGMCIPEEYWLDGDYDCMDWTDEIGISVSTGSHCYQSPLFECDEHLCPYNQWSCGDGRGLDRDCPCKNFVTCRLLIINSCTNMSLIYPTLGRIIAPHVIMDYTHDRDWINRKPHKILYQGRIKCIGYQTITNRIRRWILTESFDFYDYKTCIFYMKRFGFSIEFFDRTTK
ncbi:hypothetical protein I4U23_016881 [Adineta vaga]|nr:hypothetical protein I4U23_016881 [Adineta vaga]